jgi:methyl-accepting chemotaxis protein
MKNENTALSTADQFRGSVEKVEQNIELLHTYTAEIISSSQDVVNVVSKTMIALKELDKDMKMMDLSFQAYIKNADITLRKIDTVKENLQRINDRMDKTIDQILSIDINTASVEVISHRSELISQLNQQITQVGNMLMKILDL